MKTRKVRTSAGPIPAFMKPPLRVRTRSNRARAHPPSDDDRCEQYRGAARQSCGHDSWGRAEHRLCQRRDRTRGRTPQNVRGCFRPPPCEASRLSSIARSVGDSRLSLVSAIRRGAAEVNCTGATCSCLRDYRLLMFTEARNRLQSAPACGRSRRHARDASELPSAEGRRLSF